MAERDAAPPSLVDRALAGERLALARLLSLIDDDGPGAAAASARVAAAAGRAMVVGITGVPGGGKSTLVNALLGVWLARGFRVAVVAIDPSSPISGGAVLGDRIRMGEHAAHPDVFIRSLSARGALGGLSRATRAAVDCFDAAGFDRVVVETVGTGQSETEIVSIADSRVVVCPPGLGDDVQAIKAGLFEIADLMAVSKGDLPLADETVKDLREMLALRRKRAGAWAPRVLKVAALERAGVDALVDAIDEHVAVVGRGRRLSKPADGLQVVGIRKTPGPLGETPPELPSAALPSKGSESTPGERVHLMAAHDNLCATLGITVVDGGPGRATVTMTVDARHLNFNGGAHGGALFALADSAFGLASNSHGQLAIGIDTHMVFEGGARAGDRLIARAQETRRSRSIAFYEIEVVNVAADGAEARIGGFTGTVVVKADRRPGPH